MTELDFNYLHVGQAAKFCGAHFSALFYAEYWCRSKPYDVTVFKKQKSLLDSIYEEVNEDIADSLRTTLKNVRVPVKSFTKYDFEFFYRLTRRLETWTRCPDVEFHPKSCITLV